MKFEPELLKFENGEEVTRENFEKRRKELINILACESYGFLPPVYGKPVSKTVSCEKNGRMFCAGHIEYLENEVSFETEKGQFTIPYKMFIPDSDKPVPLFLFLNFDKYHFTKYFPVEEITDRGFAVAYIWYGDITSDDGDFTNGLAGMFTRPEDGTGFGKISLWAYGVSRVLDTLYDDERFDRDSFAVIGHSRLGKTALWCAANDERIKFAISNNAGCAGDAYERIKHEGAERNKDICKNFPFWFCENKFKYVDSPEKTPYDSHFLLAAIAPRFVLTGAASLDEWADPYSQQLSCIGATPAYELFSLKGYVGKTEQANVGDSFEDGEICFHLRHGKHFLSRNDWNIYMNIISNKRNK
ncbi:MAG: hypothetical protein K6B52_07535 [Clostridiales bacterium]|nr:hypothetical protein [Clostridiales bacterium]